MNNTNITTIGQHFQVKGGKRLPKGEMLTTSNTGHPYIRVTDFNGKYIKKTDLLFIPPNTQKKISRYTVDAGNVILSIVGSIGLVAKIPEDLNGANLTENCAKLIPADSTIDSDYLYYYLSSRI